MVKHKDAGEALSPSAQTANLAAGQRVEAPQTLSSDMDTAPKTGIPVTLLSSSGEQVDARWRSTRHIEVDERNHASWKPTGFWVVMAQSGSQKVPFEPVGWKPYAY